MLSDDPSKPTKKKFISIGIDESFLSIWMIFFKEIFYYLNTLPNK